MKQDYSLLEWTCNRKQCIHPMDSYSAPKRNNDSRKNLDESSENYAEWKKSTIPKGYLLYLSQHDQGTETENRGSFSEVKWWHRDREEWMHLYL